MVIGIDASRANRENKTGTEWYAYYLIRNFANLDKDNEYILYTDKPLTGGLFDLGSDENQEPESPSLNIEYDEKGFQKLISPHNNFKAKVLNWPFKYFWTLGGLSLEMLFYKPDVLFIPSHVLPIIHPKKSFVTIHDIGFIKDESLFAKDEIGPEIHSAKSLINVLVRFFTLGRFGANSYDYLKWSTKYALKKSHRIISISHFTKMELINYYKNYNDKIVVIQSGYPKDLYKPIDDKDSINRILDDYGIEQPYILYIGRLEKKKNITTLIEAYAILRDKYKDFKYKLLLIGPASFGYDEIKYMTREFDIVDDVLMPGWLKEDILPFIYNGASAFVFPSKYEGFSIPLLQAMACGTPIAASRVSAIPEVVGEAAVYFHPDYALSMADAIYQIISDDKIASEKITKGLERVKDYSWEKCSKKTLEIILKKD